MKTYNSIISISNVNEKDRLAILVLQTDANKQANVQKPSGR